MAAHATPHRVHLRNALKSIPDGLLLQSVWGLQDLWCGISTVERRNPHACAIAWNVQAIHSNKPTYMAEKFDNHTVRMSINSAGSDLSQFLHRHFAKMMTGRGLYERSREGRIVLHRLPNNSARATAATLSEFREVCWGVAGPAAARDADGVGDATGAVAAPDRR